MSRTGKSSHNSLSSKKRKKKTDSIESIHINDDTEPKTEATTNNTREQRENYKSLHVPTTKAIVTLMELIVTLNNFEFDDKFFTQIKGNAM